MTRHAISLALCAAALVGSGAGCKSREKQGAPAVVTKLRLGFFPNITHGAALVALARGELDKAMAPVTIEPKPFNAGPEAMEALFAGALDATYIGPAPAINGYLRSHGEGLVIVAGAALNGAGLVVRKDANIKGPADLHGKKVASPQLGNTQDVALRLYLKENGLASKERGGDVQVMPLANPDILALMKQKQLDAAWVPEPWTTRLIQEAEGTLLLDERDRWPDKKFPTTVLVVTKKLAAEQPELVRKLVAANVASIDWIRAHPGEARNLVDEGLKKYAKKSLPPQVLAEAFGHVDFSAELLEGALQKQLADGRALGFLPPEGDVKGLVDRRFLDEAVANKK
jgi:NitT/TauT family transport system substrate-binding protein